MAGRLTPAEKSELLALKKEDLTVSLITKLFAYRAKPGNAFEVEPPKFNTKSKLLLKAGEYINKNDEETTVGIFLFNKLLVEGNVEACIEGGYFNQVCTKKVFTNFLNVIAQGIINRVIPITPNVYNFLRDYEFWGMKLVTIFSPSYTMAMIKPSDDIRKMKDKLIEENKDGSLASLTDIRSKLLDKAKDDTKDDPGRTLFDSGARGSFDNDFGNMFVSVGPVENPSTGEFDFMVSNYINGISKQDLVAAGNITVNAEYPKAIGTAKGGYLAKQFNAVFQTIVLGPKDSECGTKGALTCVITKDNLSKYVDQYLVTDSGKLVLITPDLDSKYLNKKIKIRSPMYCLRLKEGDALCNHCAGDRFYKLGVTSFGLVATVLAGQIMNASLKLRHSLMVEVNRINPMEIIH